VFCGEPCPVEGADDPRGRCGRCGSPLAIADRLQLAASGNRSAARLSRRRPIRFYTTWPQSLPHPGRLEDVSPRGLRLSTQVDLADYQIVKIDAGALQAVGRVAHRGSTGSSSGRAWSVGVEFYTVQIDSGFFVSRRA
jgi:hypothetical protein